MSIAVADLPKRAPLKSLEPVLEAPPTHPPARIVTNQKDVFLVSADGNAKKIVAPDQADAIRQFADFFSTVPGAEFKVEKLPPETYVPKNLAPATGPESLVGPPASPTTLHTYRTSSADLGIKVVRATSVDDARRMHNELDATGRVRGPHSIVVSEIADDAGIAPLDRFNHAALAKLDALADRIVAGEDAGESEIGALLRATGLHQDVLRERIERKQQAQFLSNARGEYLAACKNFEDAAEALKLIVKEIELIRTETTTKLEKVNAPYWSAQLAADNAKSARDQALRALNGAQLALSKLHGQTNPNQELLQRMAVRAVATAR